MAAGDDKYLPARDKGPQRKFVRDFVDSGWHLGEAVMPAMVLVILATFIPIPAIQYYSFVGLWIFILFVIGDMIITSIRVKQAARKKFGAEQASRRASAGTARCASSRCGSCACRSRRSSAAQHPV